MRPDMTRQTPRVGIAGAVGAVGAAVARAVVDAGLGTVRLGARRPDRLRPLHAALQRHAGPAGSADPVEVAELDVDRPGELDRFCAGCHVVVNCVGPLVAPRTAVAAATWRAGAGYVDPGGDEALARALRGQRRPEHSTGLVAVGVTPGLTGLIPRWLAGLGLEPPLTLTGYVCTQEPMTPASAAEFLLGVGTDGESGAAWRAGVRVLGDLKPIPRTELPFFPGTPTAYPYLSAETEQTARALGLDEVRWYHLFESDGQVLPALGRLAEQAHRGEPLAGLAAQLANASRIEMLGRQPLQQLAIQLAGRSGGAPAHRVAVLRATSTYDLTATVTATAVEALLAGTVPPGVHTAAEILDPALVPGLAARPGVAGWHVLEDALPSYASIEQGAL
jgi:hypothetical protein